MDEIAAGYDHFKNKLVELGVYDELRESLAKKYGASLIEIFGRAKMRHVVMARDDAWFFFRERFSWSYPAIALLFGREYTSVMAGVKRHGDRLQMAAMRAGAR